MKNKYDLVIIGAGPAGIFTAIELLRRGYSVMDSAASSGFKNYQYYVTLFKKKFGQTIIDYLNSYRISKAKIIIEKSTIPYSTIFNYVGYRTKQNFNKNFIRYAGMTPREYRIKMRTKDNTHWTQSSDEKQIYYQENSEE